MNMYATGMSPYMFNHFLKVAADMNNYVAASSYHYYQNQHYKGFRDRGNFMVINQRPSLITSGLSGLIAYGLYTIGLPPSVVNLGYRFGYFIDVNS